MSTKKTPISKGIKYFALALPLLFGAPIIITMGFKALAKNNSFVLLVLGILLAILAIIVTAKAVISIMKSIFEKDEE